MNMAEKRPYDGRVFLRPTIVRDLYKYVNEVYYSNVYRGVRHSKIAAQDGAVTCTHAHQHLHELVIISSG